MFENRGNKTGLLLTVAFHLLLGTVLMFSGMRFSPSNNPDPLQIEIELEEERPPRPIRLLAEHGTAPRSPQPVPEEEPQFVQQAVVPEEMPGEQRTTESTPGDQGEVEIQDPDPPAINERALFRSRDTDTLRAEQTGITTFPTRQAGHAAGNTEVGDPSGQPTAQLEGRTVVGKLPLPEYAENLSGRVVVRILVDTYGTVTSATPGMEGTTVQNRTLWEAARKAALQARFNVSGTAPVVQEGKITYVFTLK
ncbi:MAG: energy transducer TonB [Bacteroidales bacterium]|nr:energy transducer TonB [Bacteroidales bacterium]